MVLCSAVVAAQPTAVTELRLAGRVETAPWDTPYQAIVSSDMRYTWASGVVALDWSAGVLDTIAAVVPPPTVDQLYLRWYPLFFLDLRLGRMVRDDGFAELLSPLDLYMGTDVASLSRGQFSDARLGREMAEVTVLLGAWYLRGRAAWELPRLRLPDPAAREFPDGAIPERVASRSNPETVYTRNALTVSDPPGSAVPVDTWGGEIGWSGWFADARLAVARGVRRNPVVEARVLFPDGLLAGYYDVILAPQWAEGTTVAGGAQTTVGAVRLWGEAAATIGTAVVVVDDGPGLVTVPATGEDNTVLDTVGGISYQLARPTGIVFLEYRHEWRFGMDGADDPPAFGFSNYLGIGGSVSWSGLRLAVEALGLVSTDDGSTVAIPRITWTPRDAVELSLSAGFLHGDRTTVFGQLEWPPWVEAAAVLRF